MIDRLDPAAARHLETLLRTASFELSSRDHDAARKIAASVPAGTDMFIEFLPGETYHNGVMAAAAARRAGFNPVPHVAARHLDTASQLDDFLNRLAGEAGVTRVLAIGGDSEEPRGPFATSLDLLRTGAFAKHGIRSIGVAGYPEASPRIPRRLLDQALDDKIAFARDNGIELFIVSQFAFEAEPILRWIAAERDKGIDLPIRIGLAGPASVTTLLKFAVRCGIGNSLRALRTRADSIMRMLGDATPDEILRDLAVALAQDPRLGSISLHLFTFGGIARVAGWLDSTLAALDSDGPKPVRRPA
jgi:methylenetetrahydrofolate reductase (NADPH)